ncbi:hypothetical protein [Pseudomonas purpurea]|uniref:hypothetical protein n=1 Tax=Pseudomonas purpurea TaxID=3136737 RepID=UPI0032659EE4
MDDQQQASPSKRNTFGLYTKWLMGILAAAAIATRSPTFKLLLFLSVILHLVQAGIFLLRRKSAAKTPLDKTQTDK